MISPARTSRWELPPRARRIPSTDVLGRVRDGTTSACAENTADDHTGIIAPGNYLRVRGEYGVPAAENSARLELPPRARRILEKRRFFPLTRGTTSACAENTWGLGCFVRQKWNYLRVRGEYLNAIGDYPEPVELPPRARRIHIRPRYRGGDFGTTSACAENTETACQPQVSGWNYLRVRGEYPK